MLFEYDSQTFFDIYTKSNIRCDGTLNSDRGFVGTISNQSLDAMHGRILVSLPSPNSVDFGTDLHVKVCQVFLHGTKTSFLWTDTTSLFKFLNLHCTDCDNPPNHRNCGAAGFLLFMVSSMCAFDVFRAHVSQASRHASYEPLINSSL